MLTDNYPFSAVIGQQSFKLALILSAINPAIGGVLVSGPRGCAKSTLARGIADILDQEASFVTLPLATSEEMLVGSLDLEQVLQEKKVRFNPGLLAKADQGVLYVDEVNLLSDPLVDLLLDVSASGTNHIERDGISHQHASRFILLGTMNPDEGELRAQLLDRFGLSVNLSNQISIDERIEIVEQREAFDKDAVSFIASFKAEQQALQNKIIRAKQTLADISCASSLRKLIATRCHQAQVDGLRADIVWLKAAIAHAAWSGHLAVSEADIDAVEELVLAHRRNATNHSSNTPPSSGSKDEAPFSRPPSRDEQILQQQDHSSAKSKENDGEWGSMSPVKQKIATVGPITLPKTVNESSLKSRRGEPTQLQSKNSKGGSSLGGNQLTNKGSKAVDWFASLVYSFGHWPPEQLRFKKARAGKLIINCVLLDTSASTIKRMQFSRAKAIVMQLSEAAYRQREQLVIFGFGNQQVTQLMDKQKAPKQIKAWLEEISAAGGTPLRDMLLQLSAYQSKLMANKFVLQFKNFLITDGRSSQQVDDIKLCGETLLIDTEDAAVKRGRGHDIAKQIDGQYFLLPV